MTDPTPYNESDSQAIVERIEAAVRGLRYGSVELHVHDGRIVQIERREKFRLEQLTGKRRGAGLKRCR